MNKDTKFRGWKPFEYNALFTKCEYFSVMPNMHYSNEIPTLMDVFDLDIGSIRDQQFDETNELGRPRENRGEFFLF